VQVLFTSLQVKRKRNAVRCVESYAVVITLQKTPGNTFESELDPIFQLATELVKVRIFEQWSVAFRAEREQFIYSRSNPIWPLDVLFYRGASLIRKRPPPRTFIGP